MPVVAAIALAYVEGARTVRIAHPRRHPYWQTNTHQAMNDYVGTRMWQCISSCAHNFACMHMSYGRKQHLLERGVIGIAEGPKRAAFLQHSKQVILSLAGQVGVAFLDAAARRLGACEFADDEHFCSLEAVLLQLGVKEVVVPKARRTPCPSPRGACRSFAPQSTRCLLGDKLRSRTMRQRRKHAHKGSSLSLNPTP